jgi:FkbM family methyltransferase
MRGQLREKKAFNKFLSACKDYIYPNRIAHRLRLMGLDSFLKHVSGVVHVGAHGGQEGQIYARHNLDVLWIEALPETFRSLQNNIKSFPKQKAVNALVTDKEGEEYIFKVSSNDGASSSIFDLDYSKELWPEITMVDQVKLRSRVLDNVVADDGRRFDALVMDTQGSELLVLKGAPNLLRQVKFIKTEACDVELYKGGTTTEELSHFLESAGFRLKGRFGASECCDLVFCRD